MMINMLLERRVFVLLFLAPAAAYLPPVRSAPRMRLICSASSSHASSRRHIVLTWVPASVAAIAVGSPGRTKAFDNAVPEYSKYADKPKRRGTPPKDLGVLQRTIEGEDGPVTFAGLRTCDGNPHCFSTTDDVALEDRTQKGVDSLIDPWKPPSSDAAPLRTLAKVVREYRPGEGFIDGGGFKIVTEKDGYLYVQFESLKKGFIDDVEFATGGPDGTIQVRSSSRVGVTDFGVNAIRLNTIAAVLRDQGWKVEEITPKRFRDYFDVAGDARDATFDEDRRKLQEP